ncbi:MAG: hypothetical protein IPI18_17805 [Saprospiraceae bacterium]|nr:hypothetical protein [Saprospiraceae bacterium]
MSLLPVDKNPLFDHCLIEALYSSDEYGFEAADMHPISRKSIHSSWDGVYFSKVEEIVIRQREAHPNHIPKR